MTIRILLNKNLVYLHIVLSKEQGIYAQRWFFLPK